MCPAIVTSLRPLPQRLADRQDLLRVRVDEVRAVDVPADVEADERRAAAPLHRHDLAQEHGRVLHHEVAGLEGRRDAVRPEVPRDDAGIGVEVHRPLPVPRDPPEPAAHVDLADREAGLEQPVEEPRRADERRLEPVELVAQPAGPGVEVQRVHDEPVAADGRDRVVEPVLGDAELGRPLAGVGEVLRVAGAGARVDPDADRSGPGARRPSRSSWLTPSRLIRIGWASRTSRSRSETLVPVWLISSGCQPFASAWSTSPGEQASMPTLVRVARARPGRAARRGSAGPGRP